MRILTRSLHPTACVLGARPSTPSFQKRLPNKPTTTLRRQTVRPLTIVAASEDDADDNDDWCALAFINVDNKKNPNFTVMQIEVQDYPGLLRVISWVLNGLEMVAQNAILSTSADGIANNTFWLSTRSGTKLSNATADLLADRVREFLSYW